MNEDIITSFPTEKDITLTQLLEARKLLENIKRDVVNGQISDITSDIETFFEKYPGWENLLK